MFLQLAHTKLHVYEASRGISWNVTGLQKHFHQMKGLR